MKVSMLVMIVLFLFSIIVGFIVFAYQSYRNNPCFALHYFLTFVLAICIGAIIWACGTNAFYISCYHNHDKTYEFIRIDSMGTHSVNYSITVKDKKANIKNEIVDKMDYIVSNKNEVVIHYNFNQPESATIYTSKNYLKNNNLIEIVTSNVQDIKNKNKFILILSQ